MSRPGTAPVVEAVDLHRAHRGTAGTVHALRGVSLCVHPGEMVCVEGPSGAGKSTLLHLLAGLEPPDHGHVRITGHALEQLDEGHRTTFRRRNIGVILQTFDLLPSLDAVDNVAVPAILDGCRAKEARSRARVLLERVGLTHRSAHTPAELSGGEQQRVCIARALVNQPAVILADEPTATLDSVASDEILQLLREVVADDRAVILATHDARTAAHAHRSLRLVDGAIVWPERDLRPVRSI